MPRDKEHRKWHQFIIDGLLYFHPRHLKQMFSRENIRDFISRNITHSPDSNLRLALSVGVGILIGCLPFYGYQMILAYALARVLRLNRIIALVASNISLPPMLPFILFFSYWTGCLLFGNPVSVLFSEVSFQVLGLHLKQYVIGGIVFATLAGIFAYLLSLAIFSLTRKNRD